MTSEPTDRPRVLIVDDDAVVLMLLEDICHEHGWNVATAATRDDAVLAAGLQPADLVLLDFNLDGTNALTLIPELRTVCPRTPIVVVTGQMPEDLRGLVEEVGGAGVIGKPCSVREVQQILDRYHRVSAAAVVPA